ncbi:PREDICTED: uncharacterized protein LOC109125538 [Camelina sativa]|uniref:Uncharacterized protein LOC109125538 n=1 Tax=Camelina sativa TaxID=90675 RepID=A0ABM1Q7V7_CAMSA|nr:PREDICTED: uncharacterized protein LOC109125538 [Camelina sativa]
MVLLFIFLLYFIGEKFTLVEIVDLHGEGVWLCWWSASPERIVVGCPRSVDLAGALFLLADLEVWFFVNPWPWSPLFLLFDWCFFEKLSLAPRILKTSSLTFLGVSTSSSLPEMSGLACRVMKSLVLGYKRLALIVLGGG